MCEDNEGFDEFSISSDRSKVLFLSHSNLLSPIFPMKAASMRVHVMSVSVCVLQQIEILHLRKNIKIVGNGERSEHR